MSEMINQGKVWTDEELKIKPAFHICNKCKIKKPFTTEYYSKKNNSKYGMSKICIKCDSEYVYARRHLKNCEKYNISKLNAYNPIVWYDVFLKYNLTKMPVFCYKKENKIIIIKYVIENKMNIKTKDGIIKLFIRPNIEKYRISSLVESIGVKLDVLKLCYPQFKFTEDILYPENYKDEEINSIITEWINQNNFSVEDLFKKGTSYKFSKEMHAMKACKFKNMSKNEMFIWYFNYNNIKHPTNNRKIDMFDFEDMPPNFWKDSNNIIKRIKIYCEEECNVSILKVINNTDELKKWLTKYFKGKTVSKLLSGACQGKKLYDLITHAYPCLIENHILFDWEWGQYHKNDKKSLIKMLREFILYRCNDFIIDLKNDIPKYMNSSYVSQLYSKLNRHIDKKRFNNYYQWCCFAFPEYANNWKYSDFESFVAYDNVKCGSHQEMMVYEFIKRDLEFNYLINIGHERSGNYIYQLDNNYKYKKFCPDFVLEYIDIDNKKIKINKPVIFEYFGMYDTNIKYEIFVNYVEKTHCKIDFYESLDDIIFVDIYPEDIKNNYEGIKRKMSNLRDIITY